MIHLELVADVAKITPGFRDRGMLRIGSWADIIVYNLEELGFVYDRHVWANDFPGDEKRVIQKLR